ncbi:Eukaryotic translation initiation factor 3 subunit C [Trichostrongylus colubriformis]|uniref:Eukaryotic translation initiation factor 3 subunit C n=1 Tax=Trichostrongylus colubriformis TaxID=6319 RepID=A0AAN8IB68_TRICO
MSKFFKGAVSSDSSSESDVSDVEEEVQTKKVPLARDFAYPSDSEDEEKRVVRTHKEKKFKELKDHIKQVNNGKNNKDFTKILSVFDDLCKTYEKSKTVFARQNISTPRFYVRYLVDLEDFVANFWENKEAKTALSKVNLKALTNLRQKVRKYVKEFEQKIAEYRESPDPAGYETPEEEEEADEMGNENFVAAAPSGKEKKRDVMSSDSESDSDWSSDSDSSASDVDADFGSKMEALRRHFLKKEFRGEDDGAADTKKEKKRKQRDQNKPKAALDLVDDEDDDGGEWTPITKEKQVQLFEPKQEVTHDAMISKLTEVMASRGRLGTNRKQHVRLLQELYKIAEEKKLGVGISVKILFNIISSLFELNTKISDFMEFANFNKTLVAVTELLDILILHPEVKLSVKFTEEEENLKDDTMPYKIQGSLLMTVQRLDSELTKILQNADCHSNDYIEKLKGEKDMCTLIERTEKYVHERIHEDIFDVDEVCKVYMTRIEHLYYKYQDNYEGDEPVGEIMDRLCKKIYALDEEKRLRQRAMLCHVYWLALHDEWHRARDLMLMSHLQAIVDHSDTDTQILYNRTICQLGLCAFRHGFIKEAHQGLSEIQNTQRAKELLAQAVAMRQHERTAEQEKLERQRQIPYHMHINVELMECVYLICSMLLEIPHMASCEFEMRRRLLSRSFHYQLKQSEKSSLIGPPENTREHVVAASRAMLAGDWKKCRDYIVNDKMNQKVWNLFRNSESVKEMVVKRIQTESLRTYLLMYSTVYTTVSLEKLSTLFELDKKQVHSVISKMIIQEELSATLDEPTDCLMMHRVEPSRLQMIALNFTDKLQQLADNNEQILEPRTGRAGYAGPGQWFPGRSDRQGDKLKGDRGGAYQGDRRAGQSDSHSKRAWGGTGATAAQSGTSQRRRESQKSRF